MGIRVRRRLGRYESRVGRTPLENEYFDAFENNDADWVEQELVVSLSFTSGCLTAWFWKLAVIYTKKKDGKFYIQGTKSNYWAQLWGLDVLVTKIKDVVL